MNNNFIWPMLLGIVIALLVVSRCSNNSATQPSPCATTTRVEIRYDTIYLSSIAPVEVHPLVEESPLRVDTICDDSPTPLSLYTFRDTLDNRWSAQVVGRDVELQSLTLTTPTHHHYTTQHSLPRWEITLRSDVSRLSQWAGVVLSHNVGRVRLSAHVGYAPHRASVDYGVSLGYALWSRY